MQLVPPYSRCVQELVSRELAAGPTVDITTTGARSGQPRRIEIWMLDVDGDYFITGTPGRRHWFANLAADPRLTVHLKRIGCVDLSATSQPISDQALRRRVFTHPSAGWYRTQSSLDRLVATSPMVSVTFDV